MKITNRKTLELADLQRTIISTCTHLNRPIRKSKLIQMITDLFECNTAKQVEFALLDLLEQGKLHEQGYFITPEFAENWNGVVTATDESIINFLLSLKEEAKYDIFFDVFAQEQLTPHLFFKYVGMIYPALLHREDAALTYMEHMDNTFPYGLNSNFYMEMNDYPTNRWLTAFFNNPDRRIFISNMDFCKNHVNIQVTLLAGKKRSYKQAYKDFEEFQNNITAYFNRDINIHIKKSMAFIGRKRQKRRS